MRESRSLRKMRFLYRKRLADAKQVADMQEFSQAERGEDMEKSPILHYYPQPLLTIHTTREMCEPNVWTGGKPCTFQLMQCEEIMFYECMHCRRAGAPSFHLEDKEVPKDVVDQMRLHAELCLKLER